MSKSTTVITQKKRGPRPTGKGELIGVRMLPPLLSQVDDWISRQADQPSRPEAVRRLMEQALAGHPGQPGADAATAAAAKKGLRPDQLTAENDG